MSLRRRISWGQREESSMGVDLKEDGKGVEILDIGYWIFPIVVSGHNTQHAGS